MHVSVLNQLLTTPLSQSKYTKIAGATGYHHKQKLLSGIKN
jgi:hypothetical protein